MSKDWWLILSAGIVIGIFLQRRKIGLDAIAEVNAKSNDAPKIGFDLSPAS